MQLESKVPFYMRFHALFQSHIGAIRMIPIRRTGYSYPSFQSHIGAIRIRPDKAEFDASLQLFAHFSKS